MFNKNVKLSKTITIVSIIGILIFMVICGVQVKNKGEMQIPATEMLWETSQAGTYKKTDTITITLKGVDASGIQNSSLQPSDITVYVGGEEQNPTTKTVDVVQAKGEYASYTLTLSGFSGSGKLYFKIKSGTLTDKKGKTSPDIYVGTGINIKGNTKVSATQVAAAPTTYYGKEVDYTAPNGVDDWKIFYSDGNNIFIIKSEYLPSDKVPTDRTGMTTRNIYEAWWTSAPTLQSEWSAEKTSFMHTKFNLDTNSYANAKCVSTLLNTDNWTDYVDTGKADKAIGSPTIEMWVASWNNMYPTQKLKCDPDGSTYGYKVGEENGTYDNEITNAVMQAKTGFSNTLYYPHALTSDFYWNGVRGYWLSSPSSHNWKTVLLGIRNDGLLACPTMNTDGYSLRPVVRLTSDIELAEE